MDKIGVTELVSAVRAGVVVGGRSGRPMRVVRAGSLRRCLLMLPERIDPRGVRLSNVVITGGLDLSGLAATFPLRFNGCVFEDVIVAEGAQLGGLWLTGCPQVPGLIGNGLRLRRDLDLSGSAVTGAHRTSASTSRRAAVWLCESEIGGGLLCIDSVIDGQGDRAVQADRIRVGGVARLMHRFTARGEVRMIGASIGGSLDLSGARVESPDELAIDLDDAVIGASMFVIEDPVGREPLIRGRLNLGSARISGGLVLRHATISARTPAGGNPSHGAGAAGIAVAAARLSVGAEVTLQPCQVAGGIDLSMCEASSLRIGKDCSLIAPSGVALNLTNAEIRALVRVDADAVVTGSFLMAGAVVHGTLALHGTMSDPQDRTLAGGSAMTVDGDVYLDRIAHHGRPRELPQCHAGQLDRGRRPAGQPGWVHVGPQPRQPSRARSASPANSLPGPGRAQPKHPPGPPPAHRRLLHLSGFRAAQRARPRHRGHLSDRPRRHRRWLEERTAAASTSPTPSPPSWPTTRQHGPPASPSPG